MKYLANIEHVNSSNLGSIKLFSMKNYVCYTNGKKFNIVSIHICRLQTYSMESVSAKLYGIKPYIFHSYKSNYQEQATSQHNLTLG